MHEPSNEAVDWALKAVFNTPLRGNAPAVERLLREALPIERNRWEQEVRERLEGITQRLAEIEKQAGDLGAVWAAGEAKDAINDFLAIFGEAEPVEEPCPVPGPNGATCVGLAGHEGPHYAKEVVGGSWSDD